MVFIYDKAMELTIDYDHIIDDNYERFVSVGLTDKYMINGLLENAVKKIVDKVKRNYKLAIPQYYTDKSTKKAKIQLLLPLFLQSRDVADLALVVDKGEYNYVGKTILTIEWAYVNYVYYIYKVYSKNAIFKKYNKIYQMRAARAALFLNIHKKSLPGKQYPIRKKYETRSGGVFYE